MKLLNSLGNALALAAIVLFLYLALTNPGGFEKLHFDQRTLSSLAAGVLIYLLVSVIGASTWFILLRSLRERIAWSRALSIFLVSQAAKYVPGNIAHHVGRVVLAQRQGIRLNVALYSLFIEFVLLIASASLLALAYLLTLGTNDFGDIHGVDGRWVLFAVMVLAVLSPMFGHRLIDRGLGLWSKLRQVELKPLNRIAAAPLGLAAGLFFLGFLLCGVLLQLFARQVFGHEGGGILALSGIFAGAWVIGFISPGAPAGLGIREVVLLAALTPIYGKEIAIAMAGLLRVTTVIGDGAALLGGLAVSHRKERH